MLIQINAHLLDLNMTQVYVPTADSTDEEFEDFYQQLESIRKVLKKQGVTINGGF